MSVFKYIFKNRAAVFCLCLACVIAIAGAGFSAWFFTSGTSVSTNFNIIITGSSVDDGSFKYDGLPEYVILDSGSRGGVNATVTGIEFYKVGYSGYDTENDRANYEYDDNGIVYDSDGVPVEQSGGSALNKEVLTDKSFTIEYEYKGCLTEEQAENVVFGLGVGVQGFLTKYIVNSDSYYSNDYTRVSTAITGEDNYYLDLKALCSQGSGYEYSWKADATSETTVFTFTLTTTLLNTFFAYTYDNVASSDSDRATALYTQIKKELEEFDYTSGNDMPEFVIYLMETSSI